MLTEAKGSPESGLLRRGVWARNGLDVNSVWTSRTPERSGDSDTGVMCWPEVILSNTQHKAQHILKQELTFHLKSHKTLCKLLSF